MLSKIYIFLVAFLTYTEMEKGSAASSAAPFCSQALAVLQTFVCFKVPNKLKVRGTVFAHIFKLQMTKTGQKREKKLSYKKPELAIA